MKKIKKTYFSIINKIIAIIAAFTGLQACGPAIPAIHPLYSPPAPLPLAEFSISGRVETKLNTPIPNIEVYTTTPNELNGIQEDFNVFSRSRSDNLGNFHMYIGIDEDTYCGEGEFTPPKEVALIFRDIDGEQYGEFKTDTVIVPLEFTKDTTYSNAPYRAKVTDLVVTLEEKKQNNEEENDNE